MKASVITVCFNSGRTIRRTIESVLKQTASDFEYLIIDGGSTDSTLSVIEGFRPRFEKRGIPYRVYSGKDQGIYDAMNKGIRLSKGEVIAIINSDDWYSPIAIQTAVDEYNRQPYDICMCSLYIWKGDCKYLKKPKVRRYKTSRDLCHPSMFVARKGYKKIGLYNRKVFYGDFDFWLRAFKKGADIAVANKVVANYTVGGVSNQKTLKKMAMRIRDRYAVYLRNDYSKLYFIESAGIEIIKMILA